MVRCASPLALLRLAEAHALLNDSRDLSCLDRRFKSTKKSLFQEQKEHIPYPKERRTRPISIDEALLQTTCVSVCTSLLVSRCVVGSKNSSLMAQQIDKPEDAGITVLA
eukprot:scaffold398_cov356-Pavlova_lutheri.AAC.4